MHASGYVSKPVNEEKIRKEIDGLRFPIELKEKKKVQVKCFGNFDVFHEGAPLRFSYSKSKEVFAYLIDREGVGININELNAVLWEEDHKSYLRDLIVDIQRTLKSVGAEDVFVKRHNECFIDTSKVDCDAYEYKANNPDAIRMYRGEYMIQYPWAIFDAE
jgi:two-component SAPR family response regulator